MNWTKNKKRKPIVQFDRVLGQIVRHFGQRVLSAVDDPAVAALAGMRTLLRLGAALRGRCGRAARSPTTLEVVILQIYQTLTFEVSSVDAAATGRATRSQIVALQQSARKGLEHAREPQQVAIAVVVVVRHLERAQVQQTVEYFPAQRCQLVVVQCSETSSGYIVIYPHLALVF